MGHFAIRWVTLLSDGSLCAALLV